VEGKRFLELLSHNLPDAPYWHWDELRHRRPPEGLNSEEWWLSLRLRRQARAQPLPVQDARGKTFSWFLTNSMQLILHKVDMGAGGRVSMPSQVTNHETRDQYYVSSLMEEAITSSQIEGAATTREIARDMLRSQRKPRDTGERMILNNYLTMRQLERWKNQDLTPDLIFEIHRSITQDTLEDPTAAGRLRRPDEIVEVVDEQTEEVLHVPPPAHTLPTRLQALCDFANQPDETLPFIHPVLRGILLHFWLAYDHPFKDGNGRTARALFYWLMLRRDFWLFQFISISQIILRSRRDYGMAFLKTETDSNDLNYFLLHQLQVIEQAIAALHDYIRRKTQELEEVGKNIKAIEEFNHRQQALLNRALRHPGTSFTIESHQNSHAVSYATARSDLLRLVKLQLLNQRKRGKAFVFEAPVDLEQRLRQG
jgi:Fic family protein